MNLRSRWTRSFMSAPKLSRYEILHIGFQSMLILRQSSEGGLITTFHSFECSFKTWMLLLGSYSQPAGFSPTICSLFTVVTLFHLIASSGGYNKDLRINMNYFFSCTLFGWVRCLATFDWINCPVFCWQKKLLFLFWLFHWIVICNWCCTSLE